MIDWDRVDCLRQEIGEEDFVEVLRLFMQEAEDITRRLAYPGPPSAREADLHFPRGSALNLGFSDLAALCLDQERRAGHGEEIDTGPVIRLYLASRERFLIGINMRSGEVA